MKHKKFYTALALMFFLLLPAGGVMAGSPGDKDMDAAKENIWKLEEAYFTRLYQADYDGVLALTHPQFLGWPGSLDGPLDYEASARFMKQLISRPTPCKIKIERAGIRVTDRTALTQYTLHVDCGRASDAKPVKPSRITHTWVKEGGRWLLLGGMSHEWSRMEQ